MEVYIKGGHGYDCYDYYDTYIMLCSAIIAVYSKGVFPDEQARVCCGRILAELLEAGTGERGVEVDTLEERIDLDRGLSRRREGTLGALASGTETTESTRVGGEIWKSEVSFE